MTEDNVCATKREPDDDFYSSFPRTGKSPLESASGLVWASSPVGSGAAVSVPEHRPPVFASGLPAPVAESSSPLGQRP